MKKVLTTINEKQVDIQLIECDLNNKLHVCKVN